MSNYEKWLTKATTITFFADIFVLIDLLNIYWLDYVVPGNQTHVLSITSELQEH